MWLLIVVAVLVVAGTAALVSGLTPAGAAAETAGAGVLTSTHAHQPLPIAGLAVSDLDGLLFDRAIRGYRMDEVDAVIARLREGLLVRDATIADLRHALDDRSAEALLPPLGPGAGPAVGAAFTPPA